MLRTLPIFLAFLAMGIADAMGPMSDAVKTNYQISNVMATLMSFFVFIAFAVFSVPSGILAARIGKKNLLLLGLGINAVACLVPTLMVPNYPLLLSCIFMLGVGTTFLQVSGNPIMRDVSSEGAYSRNLSFAQGIKGIGSTASTYLVTAVIGIALFANMGWRGVFPLFFLVMAVAFLLVLFLKVNETKADVPPSLGSSFALLKNPTFFMAVVGIFLYVGAEVCMARFLVPLEKAMGMSAQSAAIFGATMFFGLVTVGRLVGGMVLLAMTPRAFFRISALLGLVGAGLLMTGNTTLAIVGVVCAGLGFANIWPMLFSITVEEKPENASELSGLMCMAISGGAIVPLVMSKMVDMDMKAFAFVVPAVCFAYLFLLSLKGGKKPVAAK
ncbi:MAG: MFS transporter [Chitinispirillaceae bacterium]|jgi:fucose permease|nr:MFS transporter [Chitinispirillaceae bacterium]